MGKGKMYVNGIIGVTTTISKEQHDLAKKYNITWHRALSFGIRFLVEKEKRLNDEIKGSPND